MAGCFPHCSSQRRVENPPHISGKWDQNWSRQKAKRAIGSVKWRFHPQRLGGVARLTKISYLCWTFDWWGGGGKSLNLAFLKTAALMKLFIQPLGTAIHVWSQRWTLLLLLTFKFIYQPGTVRKTKLPWHGWLTRLAETFRCLLGKNAFPAAGKHKSRQLLPPRIVLSLICSPISSD